MTRWPVKGRTLGKIASAAAVLTLGGVGFAAVTRSRNPYYDGPVSDHFDGVRFFMPDQPADRGLVDMLRWQAAGGRAAWPATYPSAFRDIPPAHSDRLRIALVGHSSMLVQVAGVNILSDPVWSERASPFRRVGPKRVNPPGIAFADLPRIDAVLVTHGHYDHLDTATLSRIWERDRPRVVAPLGSDTIVHAYDDAVAVDTLDWGQSLGLPGGLAVHFEPALHWSARGVNDRRMSLWGAYLLTTPDGPVYLAGDTGYGDGATFRAIRTRYGRPRVAVLPIGAYEPRWFMRQQHMNPAEAVTAFRDLEAEQGLGVHWGTFQLTNEAVDAPERDLGAALDEACIPPDRFRAMRPGEVWEAGPADGSNPASVLKA